MNAPLLRLITASALLGLLLAAAPPPEPGRHGMVAADHRLASQAGAFILDQGGNAVDAAVATALAAGVVQPAGSGLGGGGFAVVVPFEGEATILDFREVAPAAATRDMYANAADPKASSKGGLSIAVPGEPMGLVALHARFGRLPLARVVKPAAELASRGFPLGGHLWEALERLDERAGPFAALLFDHPLPEGQGDRVGRADLGRSILALARAGGAAFRTGAIAQDIVDSARAAGGILTMADLAAYEVKERPPLVGSYRGWEVVTMPPPSSGGAVLLQILGVLEGFELGTMSLNSAEHLHLLTEAMKHAYADRAHYMGDPDRVEVPLDALLAPSRIAEIQRSILPSRTFPPERYGTLVDLGKDAGTQHISVLDADGLAVSLTTTINTSFGSEVMARRSGILLNDEMDDFVARPGVPNAYGLVGSEANAVAPGARPLSSMSPTVLRSPDGRRIVVGASGGPTIISATLQVVSDIIDFGMDPAEAVGAPRIHHQWTPDILFVDEGISADTIAALRARGHEVKQQPAFSAVQAISAADGISLGASDPRKGGWPAAATGAR